MKVIAAFIGVVLVWSTTPLAIFWSIGAASPLFAVTARMTLGAVICSLWLVIRREALPLHAKAWLSYLAGSLSLFLGMLLTYVSAPFIPTGLVSVLFGLTPLMTALLAVVLLGEAICLAQLFGLILGLVGLACVLQIQNHLPAGGLWAIAGVLVAVLLFSLSSVLIKRINSGISALSMTCGTLALSSSAYWCIWLVMDGHWPPFVLKESLSILYLGFFGSVLGFVWYYYVLERMAASRLALITLITPVLALLLGHGLNGEPVLLQVWIGCACIVLALVCYQWGNLAFPRRSLTR